MGGSAAAVLLLGGCGRESTLSPHSHAERQITTLWWVMMWGAVIGFALVAGLLFLGWLRRNRAQLPLGGDERTGTFLVVGLGVALPIVVLGALFLWADVFVIRSTAAPLARDTKLRVDVRAQQWFWVVSYPGTKAVTANELHIPVRTPVNLVGGTGDVIHSFWVPELNRKMDLIPGSHTHVVRNRLLLNADRVGMYPGRCSEFCGLQHANMQVFVYADSPATYRAWLRNMAADARAPTTDVERRGQQLFLSKCASCHQIRGTGAVGQVGPDLTHFATRHEIAAGALPNTRPALGDWIRDPQRAKPGNKMPRVPLAQRQIDALVGYLESLR